MTGASSNTSLGRQKVVICFLHMFAPENLLLCIGKQLQWGDSSLPSDLVVHL
jgi:hypothetical protein